MRWRKETVSSFSNFPQEDFNWWRFLPQTKYFEETVVLCRNLLIRTTTRNRRRVWWQFFLINDWYWDNGTIYHWWKVLVYSTGQKFRKHFVWEGENNEFERWFTYYADDVYTSPPCLFGSVSGARTRNSLYENFLNRRGFQNDAEKRALTHFSFWGLVNVMIDLVWCY